MAAGSVVQLALVPFLVFFCFNGVAVVALLNGMPKLVNIDAACYCAQRITFLSSLLF